MYHSNITHFLNEHRDIPKDMLDETRGLAYFLTLIIAEATDFNSEKGFDTGIPCINKGCEGT